ILHRDDEGKAELLDIGAVQAGEGLALLVGERVKPGGRLFGSRFRRQALCLCQLSGKVGVCLEDAEALILVRRAEDAGKRVVKAAGAVVRRAKFQIVGAFGDPRGMLEDAAEAADEILAAHSAWSQGWRDIGMVLAPV